MRSVRTEVKLLVTMLWGYREQQQSTMHSEMMSVVQECSYHK